MKILFCTNAFEVVSNGPAKFAQLLLNINEIYPHHEIRILTEDIKIPVKDKIYKQTVKIPKFGSPFGMFIRMGQYHTTAMQIRKNDYNFDVLVYNNAIVGLRSGFSFSNTIGFINDDNNASASWKSALLKMQWKKTHVFFIVELLATRFLKKTIANSNYLATFLKKRYHIPNKKITYLYKAIELEPTNMQRTNKVPHILFVKNDYKRGGLFILIETLKQLNTKVELTIIGPPESARHEILTFAAADNIICNFRGIQTQNAVYAQMREADIFCVPSLKEGLGVANIEAMALGCSVITTNAGGIPEVMDYGRNGWLAIPNDVQSLVGAFQSYFNEPELREKKRNNAKQFIEKFKLTTALDSFIQILEAHE